MIAEVCAHFFQQYSVGITKSTNIRIGSTGKQKAVLIMSDSLIDVGVSFENLHQDKMRYWFELYSSNRHSNVQIDKTLSH